MSPGQPQSFSYLTRRQKPPSSSSALALQKKRTPNPIELITKIASSVFRSILPSLRSLLTPACRWPVATVHPSAALPRRQTRKITGTFFGRRGGRVCFSVQAGPAKSDPAFLLELAIPTVRLIEAMASGTVRILLECERRPGSPTTRALWEEPRWVMYCNGRQLGHAVSRSFTDFEVRVLDAVRSVSAGAGVVPVPDRRLEGGTNGGGSWWEVMYMRAEFKRVVGGRDSEALYMISPEIGDGGGPELSVYLLRM